MDTNVDKVPQNVVDPYLVQVELLCYAAQLGDVAARRELRWRFPWLWEKLVKSEA